MERGSLRSNNKCNPLINTKGVGLWPYPLIAQGRSYGP